MSTSPIDRPCSFCAAEPGSPCNRPRGSRDGFHAARLSPAVRGASFSGSKNLVESRSRGARRGAAKKKARAKKPEPRNGRVFSVFWYVRSDRYVAGYHGPRRIQPGGSTYQNLVEIRAILHRRSEIREVRDVMRRLNDGRVRVVRVTVRVLA